MGVGVVVLWQRHELAAGMGVGLVMQAAFTLMLDILAEARGTEHLLALGAVPT
jgi:hypothetical protein